MADTTAVALEISDEMEEEVTGKRKKRSKSQKKVKRAKVKRHRAGLIGIIVLVVLVIASGVFLYLTIRNDWGGVRTSVIAWVNGFDPDYKSIEDRHGELKAEMAAFAELVAQQETQFAADRAQLTADQEKLASDRNKLSQEKKDVENREISVAAEEIFTKPLYLWGLNDDKISELKQLGKIYDAMEPDKAADIMSRLYDTSHVAAIIYYMSTAGAAEVMSEMSEDMAARVTMVLLRD